MIFNLHFLFGAFLHLIVCSRGERILLVSFDHPGQIGALLTIGQAVKAKGYEVYALVLKKYESTVILYGLEALVQDQIKSITDDEEFFKEIEENLYSLGANPSFMDRIKEFPTFEKLAYRLEEQVYSVFHNEDLWSKMEDLKFDLAVIDSIPTIMASYLIPYKLGIPYVTLTFLLHPWLVRLPSLPSIEPTVYTYGEMSFAKRIKNIFLYILPLPHPADEIVRKYAPRSPFQNIIDIYKNSEIFLVNSDPYILDYPRIESNHVKYIGFVSRKSVNRLEERYRNILSSAKHGVVIVSFGYFLKQMPLDLLKSLLKVFSSFQETFIIRYAGKLDDVVIPVNVHIETLIPQLELLQHPKVKLFITHCGLYGMLEAFYNGVPMLMLPLGQDQPYNAHRAERRGYGKIFDVFKNPVENLQIIMQKMLSNSTYKDNIDKGRSIKAEFPPPPDAAAFWIDHVIRFGSDHLKPAYLDMPLYQFFMLDIVLLFLVVFHCTCFTLYFIVKKICQIRVSHKNKTD